MKGTEQFKEIIKNYLDNRAKEDELFRAKYKATARSIDDIVTYIFNEVQHSGCCGFWENAGIPIKYIRPQKITVRTVFLFKDEQDVICK